MHELIAPALNFSLLVIVLILVTRKPVKAMIASRQATIRTQVVEAQTQKSEAEKRYREFSQKLSTFEAEAKTILDAIATQAKTEKGYIIEVAGHASADGKLELNRKLSQERADEVIRYLVESHDIPLRRIAVTIGYGIAKPVADNTTKEGREQNRRVDVKILVNKGLLAPVKTTRPAASGGAGE